MEASKAYSDIENASERIKGHVIRTPLLRAEKLSALTGVDLWLKLECMQYTLSLIHI